MQLNGSRKLAGALIFSAVLVLAGITGFAQQQATQGQDGSKGRTERSWRGGKRGGRAGFFGGRFAEKLNLTDAQKEQIRQITARYRESAKALRQQGRGERRGGFDAFKGGTFDEAQVRAAAQARANARVEMEVQHARMMSEIYNVLTPEQKAQLAAERQQREQKMQEWRARRKANQGQIQQQ
ncbi:MAG: Spy/CpxP family protein refolding chaperone [Pyrinomonadaceae bacterium]|nr:Spy/CpxP family protein refolding chaperone [Pyrinomonadaceae bacterium]